MIHVERLLESLKNRFQLTYGEPFSLSYNFVVPVQIGHERDAVLKIGYPNNDFSNEFHALQDFQGMGMVKVLDYSKGRRLDPVRSSHAGIFPSLHRR